MPCQCLVLLVLNRTQSLQLRKTDMLRKGQEGHVRAERDVLKSASLVNSPSGADWIVRLYYSFQDRDHLYLVSVSSIVFPILLHFFEPTKSLPYLIYLSYRPGARVDGWRRSSQPPNRTGYLRGRFHKVLYRRGK